MHTLLLILLTIGVIFFILLGLGLAKAAGKPHPTDKV
jgi:hypothetical protein